MEKVLSPTVAICNGRETILLGTYNYMGMTFDDDVIAAGKEALDKFGSGTTGSRVLNRSEEHTSELQSLMRTSYSVFCLQTQSSRRQRNPNNNTLHASSSLLIRQLLSAIQTTTHTR